MSSREQFNVIYDGPALAEHRMDVRDLAPALVAISDLFAAANKELNGDKAEIRVEVKGSFKSGSFGIELIFTQDLLAQIQGLLNSPAATAICNAAAIAGIIGVTGKGLFWLLHKLQGRTPHKIEMRGDLATVWVSETESVTVEEGVVRLYRSRNVRASLEKVLSPLEKEGITDFGIIYKGDVVVDLHDVDLPSFRPAVGEAAEIVSDTTSRKLLLIESVVFKEDNKWRVHDGQYPFHAAIEDVEFLARINQGERFGKGDVLVVDLQQTQLVENGSLRTEYRIIKVHEHREPLQKTLI